MPHVATSERLPDAFAMVKGMRADRMEWAKAIARSDAKRWPRSLRPPGETRGSTA
jgi:hypothetical protein